ncbi:maleylpyruvate isomerase family mycothiol-dependent enzyme [Nocardioides nanhaiensis]
MGENRGDVWAVVHRERRLLYDQLARVPPEAWEEPSPCPGWSVHDVVAHLVDTARTTRLGFVLGLARAGFDFDRQNARGVAAARGVTPAETLERLRAVVDRRTTPPAPLATRLVEAFVHGEDVRGPLGLVGDYPGRWVGAALELQARTGTGLGGAREHVAGLRLAADDVDLVLGEGPAVTGPVISLLCAASGRADHLEQLAGDGVPLLGHRLFQAARPPR